MHGHLALGFQCFLLTALPVCGECPGKELDVILYKIGHVPVILAADRLLYCLEVAEALMGDIGADADVEEVIIPTSQQHRRGNHSCQALVGLRKRAHGENPCMGSRGLDQRVDTAVGQKLIELRHAVRKGECGRDHIILADHRGDLGVVLLTVVDGAVVLAFRQIECQVLDKLFSKGYIERAEHVRPRLVVIQDILFIHVLRICPWLNEHSVMRAIPGVKDLYYLYEEDTEIKTESGLYLVGPIVVIRLNADHFLITPDALDRHRVRKFMRDNTETIDFEEGASYPALRFV